MTLLGTIILFVGVLIQLVSWVLILIMAFNDEFLWGLLSLVIPPVAIIYVIVHMEETKYILLTFLCGASLSIIGKFIIQSAA
jgi:hypothetical protein